jgi:phosphoglycolate phosphatase-like HAD superfamily hydrolase
MAETEDNPRHYVVIASILAITLLMAIMLILVLPYVSDFTPVLAGLNNMAVAVLSTMFGGLITFVALTIFSSQLKRRRESSLSQNAQQPSDLPAPENLSPDRISLPQEVPATAFVEVGLPAESNLGAAAFLEMCDLKTVVGIDIMAITGEITIRQICETLERTPGRRSIDLKARILLRADSSSDSRRILRRGETRAALDRVRQSIDGLKYEIRHYSSVSPLRAVMLNHDDGTHSAHLSFYDWHADDVMTGRESSTPWCHLREHVGSNDKLLSLYRSWFLQFWGKHRIHTLIFDFDDTLFQTTEIQVDAWVTALETALSTGLIKWEELTDEVGGAATDTGHLHATMRTIFLDEQEELRIADRVFRQPLGAERFEFLRGKRLKARDAATVADATPISSITDHLRQLKEEYQLVIVSATSEHTIQKVLGKHDLNFFSYIFGKEALHSWKDIESKTPTFIRASNMLGIPLDRMAFIGDSDADFRTARQLGLKFIESRANANRFGRSTLIRSRAPEDDDFVIGADGAGLIEAIARVEASIRGPDAPR